MRADSHSAISDELSVTMFRKSTGFDQQQRLCCIEMHTHELITSFHVLYAHNYKLLNK